MATDNGKQDELDQLLDAALAKYATAEPRAGLEERVLANLRAGRARVPDRTWWRWSVAAVAAILVVAIALALKLGKPLPPQVVHHAPASIQVAHDGPKMVSNTGGNGVRVPRKVKGTVRRATARRAQPQAAKARNPKLDQFPSPQPLSEQEKTLANYVASYPEHAALIARARTEALHQDRVEEMRDAAASSEQDSQHQDR
jgi:hypothetical protein